MRVLLIVYDNESLIHFFPQGIAYIAAAMRKEGIDVDIYSQDIHHYPDEHLTKYLDENTYDLIGLGAIGGYYQFKKILSISKSINASKNRPSHYVLGGHGPSPDPEYFMRIAHADIIVRGEGEQTIVDLCRAIAEREPLSSVAGIAYRSGKNVNVNAERKTIKDVDSIHWPAYDLFDCNYYRLLRLPHADNTDFVMPIISARGCPFHCNFCYRMDKGYRMRSPEAIVDEIRFLQLEYRINYIDFSDELLMASPHRVEELCKAVSQSRLKIKWYCNGRLNFAQPDILKLMRDTGCIYINYGIEAFDDRILQVMDKKLTTKEIINGIEATLDAGISPGFNVIFGNIGEDLETLNKGVEFLLKYDDCSELRTIRPVTPYPGSPLFDYAVEKGLIADTADFYENKHLNSDLLSVNFTNLTDEEYYHGLMDANLRLIENNREKGFVKVKKLLSNLYENRDPSFRGFRQS